MPNERVAAIERRHKDLGLKDLGADEIAEDLNTIYWMICGSRFILMEDHDLVRDAMPLPPSSDDIFEYTGKCQFDNTKIPEVVVAFFERKNGTNVLPARAAWKIDRKKGFVKLPTEGLRCE